jgi:hypothetical protein
MLTPFQIDYGYCVAVITEIIMFDWYRFVVRLVYQSAKYTLFIIYKAHCRLYFIFSQSSSILFFQLVGQNVSVLETMEQLENFCVSNKLKSYLKLGNMTYLWQLD